MILNKLKLTNYRKFNDLSFEFHKNLTVLVGQNSSGKTSILDALKVILWPFVSGFDLGSTTNAVAGIEISDVRLEKSVNGNMEYRLESSIEAFGDVFGVKHWKRYRDNIKKNTRTKEESGSKQLKQEAMNLEKMIFSDNSTELSLPVVCYYGTGRLWNQKYLTQSIKNESEVYSRTFAYRNCLDPSSSFKHFIDWYTYIFKAYREAQIKKLEKSQNINDISSHLSEPIVVIQTAVNHLLEKQVEWKNLSYSEEMEQEIVLESDKHGMLKVSMMSDGIRNILSLVSDIAYRCYKLNPHLGVNAAMKSQGIVLIDEIDMHLHPRWQQSVVNDLTQAFPNIQFVITTHSPQVISTVDSKSIRIFDDNKVFDSPGGTEGAESSRILKRVLGVDPRPQENQISKDLNKYLEMVYSDNWNSDVAIQLRKRLDDSFDGEEPALFEADLYIENKIWERNIEKSF